MTLLRKCLLELRAHHQDHQMNELNGHDIEDLRPGMHATFEDEGEATVMTTSVVRCLAQCAPMRAGAQPLPAGVPA